MELTQDVLKEWNDALLNVGSGNYNCTQDFKELHPDEFKFLSAMLSKRKKIRSNVKAMRTMSDNIYWGTLTYESEHNDLLETTKRKQAIAFLNKHFALWFMVEEYGKKSGRYHIHFLATKRDGELIDYDVLRSDWHSFLEIERIERWKQEKKIKYITNYIKKDLPRLRRCKRLVALERDYRKLVMWRNLGFNFYNDEYYKNNADMLDLPF